MARSINITRFNRLVKTAEGLNTRIGSKRFIPIQSRDGKILVFGLYDYQTKKQIYSRPFEDIDLIFDEIEDHLTAVARSMR